MTIIQKHMRFGILAVAALLVSACQSTPEILHETSPAANFAGYKTFGFFSPLGTDKAGYQSAFTGHLKTASRRAMESKGYVYSDTNADVLLNFYGNIQDKQEIVSSPAPMAGGYYGYRTGYYGGFGATSVDTYNYKQGTLTIDLVDPKQKALAWTATAEGRVSSDALKNPGPAIDTLVTSMMTTLTPASH